MNGLERVLAAVKGEKADRPAAAAALCIYGSRLTSCGLVEYYSDPLAYAKGQAAVKARFDPDILFGPFALALEGAAFGSAIAVHPDNAPTLKRPGLPDAASFLKAPLPDPARDPYLRYLHEGLRILAAERGADTAIAAIGLSPVDLLPMVIGSEAWLDSILFRPEEARRAIERCAGYFVERANRFFAEGAHFLALPVVFCNPRILTLAIVLELALPILRNSFALLDGLVVIHHGGSPLLPFIKEIAELPNVAGLVIDKTDKFRAARAAIGPEKVLMGNVDGPSLDARREEDVARHCAELVRERAADPRWILATSAADVPLSTDPAVIDSFFGSVRCGEGLDR
jgi:uroporphyrinogen decarboxylase